MELYKRRVRIEGKPEDLAGYMVSITDADTGEMIPNVFAITARLNVRDVSTARITYYETDADGNMLIKDGKPVIKKKTIDNPIIAITAMEQLSELEKLIGTALMDANLSGADSKKLVSIGEKLTQDIIQLVTRKED